MFKRERDQGGMSGMVMRGWYIQSVGGRGGGRALGGLSFFWLM